MNQVNNENLLNLTGDITLYQRCLYIITNKSIHVISHGVMNVVFTPRDSTYMWTKVNPVYRGLM